ncbi:MAG: ATP-binding protein [Bacteroidota bacterium]
MIEAGLYSRSITYLDSAYKHFNNPGPGDLFQRFNFRANYFRQRLRNYDMAMAQADSILLVINESNIKDERYASQTARAWLYKGDIFLDQKKFAEAFRCFSNCLQAGRDQDNFSVLNEYSNRLAMICYRQGKYEKAIEYFRDQIAVLAGKPDDDFYAFSQRQATYDNLGLSYFHLGMPDSAEACYRKAMQIVRNQGKYFPDKTVYLQNARGVIMGNMADVLVGRGLHYEASELLRKGIRCNMPITYYNQDAQMSMLKLADIYLKTDQSNKAGAVLEELVNSLDSLPNPAAQTRLHKLSWKYFEKIGDTKNAYLHLQEYMSAQDSTALDNREIASLDFSRELLNMEQEDELKELKKEKQRIVLWLGAAGIGILMTLAIIWLVWRDRNRKKKNVKELTRLNSSLEVTLGVLEQAQADNKRILRIVAHDLRSPVASMIAAAGMLHNEAGPNEDQVLTELIMKSGNISMELISDLLHVHTRRQDLKLESIDLTEVLRYCIDMNKFKAVEKKQEITFQPIPAVIRADRENIWRLFSNLIGNAIKFSDEKTEIIVRMMEQPDLIIVEVEDHGIGIPEEFQDRIFEMYPDSRRAGTSGEETFGLGLSICRQIAEAHDGKIWFRSEAGKGTVFIVELPAEPTSDSLA